MNTTRMLARFHLWRMRNVKESTFILVLAVIVGLLAGFVALTMKVSVFYLRQLVIDEIIGVSKKNMLLLLIFPAIGIGITVIFKYLIINDTVKHNISSILHAISSRNSLMKRHKIFSSLLGGILTAGFGGSVGVESPIISSGAAIGSNLGRIFHFNYKTITLLLACGSAGAIAAIFNTPIAGVVFALEVLLLDLSRFSLIPLLIASVSGTIVTTIFYPDDILFDFQITESFKVSQIHFYIIFAFLTGIVAYYFNSTYLKVENKIEEIKNTLKRFLFGAVSFGILLFLFPALWGEGFTTIKALLNEDHISIFYNTLYTSKAGNVLITIVLFIFLILLKVVATALSVGAGGIGGIFAPSLFTGALSGYLYAFVINSLPLGVELSLVNFAMIGMAGVLSGVLHAPLTGLFLIAEITFGYELIVPLMITTAISFITVKYFGNHSIITSQLAMKGELITHHKDKAVLTMMKLKSVLETDFSTVYIDDNLKDLVKVVAKSKRNLFPVLDKENMLCGIILLDDIREIMFNKSLYKKELVKNLMSIPPAFIKMDENMESVMKKFKDTGAWNLPVIDKGHYIGFVSKSKMFNVYRELLVNISAE
ncbi:MAG: chloride channel protein [Bacteroidales bacterium]|nr:chloride channel protein [Bacteroidales bacterium]MBN2757668.1 chloride channel protein [Bacteroidales bacterium]